MAKVTRIGVIRGLTRIDAPYIIGIILLFLGMSILDRPGAAIIPLMVQYNFPVNEYALLILVSGVFAVTLRKLPISVLLPLAMIPYIFYTYWYFHLQPGSPLNSSIITAFLYFCLMLFMMRAQAIYYRRDVHTPPSTYMEYFADELSKLRADVLAGLIMVVLGALVHARPVGGVAQFAAEAGVNIRLYSWWLIGFGLLRLRKYRSAWDVWLVIPLLFYCIFTFVYVAEQPIPMRNPILGILYVSLFLFTIRANLSGRG